MHKPDLITFKHKMTFNDRVAIMSLGLCTRGCFGGVILGRGVGGIVGRSFSVSKLFAFKSLKNFASLNLRSIKEHSIRNTE